MLRANPNPNPSFDKEHTEDECLPPSGWSGYTDDSRTQRGKFEGKRGRGLSRRDDEKSASTGRHRGSVICVNAKWLKSNCGAARVSDCCCLHVKMNRHAVRGSSKTAKESEILHRDIIDMFWSRSDDFGWSLLRLSAQTDTYI